MIKTKIILIDDHTLVRDGIRSLIEKQKNICIVGETSNSAELMEILNREKVDLVIMDISMPEINGIDLTKIIKHDFPNIKVLILSMYTDEDYIFSAIAAGASGYLPKNTSKQDLIKAINSILLGNDYFSEEISQIMLNSYLNKAKNSANNEQVSLDVLSKREKEILCMVVNGVSNQSIAEQLFISVRTVESHKTHIMQKLKISNLADLVKFAIKNNITCID